MSGCGVCISSYGDFGECTGYRCVVVKAGKEWNCSECGCTIPKKSRYELASGFNDGSFWQTKTCLVCADIAEALSCNGRWHGTLWDGVDGIVEKLNIACLYKMSLPESKKKIQGVWIEWLDQEIARRRARKVEQLSHLPSSADLDVVAEEEGVRLLTFDRWEHVRPQADASAEAWKSFAFTLEEALDKRGEE